MDSTTVANLTSAISSTLANVTNSTSHLDLTGDKPKTCSLIQGPIALAAQLCLLVVVVSALSIKRHRERPRRALNVWLLDISKQGCSGLAGHAVGMGVAIVAHSQSHASSQCGWYFVVYFADCTLGLTLALLFHKLMSGLAELWHFQRVGILARADSGEEREHGHLSVPWWDALVEIGNYGDPPRARRWLIQAVGWMTCVVSARLIVGVVVVTSIPLLQDITLWMDRYFRGHEDAYLLTVMVGIPVVINCGQAWIQDQVLKFRRKITGTPPNKSAAVASHPQVIDIVTSSPGFPTRGRERELR